MKDKVENRSRIGLARKARLLRLVVQENGVVWTLLFGLYYACSTLAELAFGRMDRLRREQGLPGLSSARLNAEIWNDWDWSGGGDEWTLSEGWKDSLVENVLQRQVPEDLDVLEIGPGAGRWTEHLMPRARSLVGVDISEKCVAVCSERFGGDGRARFFQNDGASLAGVDDASVDRIWSFDVFVHINESEVEKYSREFARVLRPGGRGIVHHGMGGGAEGGWRSNLTAKRFVELLEASGLGVLEQIEEWNDGGRTVPVGKYDDMVTVFEKPASAS